EQLVGVARDDQHAPDGVEHIDLVTARPRRLDQTSARVELGVAREQRDAHVRVATTAGGRVPSIKMRSMLPLTVLVAAVGCGARPTSDVAVTATSACMASAAHPTTLWLDFAGANVVHASSDDSAAMPVQSRLAPPMGASVPAFDHTPIAPKVTREQAIAAI